MPSVITTIFFDGGNTLLFPNRRRIHAPLAERSVLPEAQHLRDLERKIKNEFDSQITQSGTHDQSFWWMYYTQLLEELEIEDGALRDRLVESIRDSGNWDQIPAGTREQLNEIGKRYRMGVISNADGRIENVLRRCGIADCFLSITDSGLVGYEKPHPEIFRQALATLNATADESVYVGDMYSVDYLGAENAGMRAVLMDVSCAYKEKPATRVESLEELRRVLADGKFKFQGVPADME